MKKLLLGIIAAVLWGAGGSWAGPQIAVPEGEFNFGKVPQSATICHTYWLRSTGDDTLRITKIVPGCGCTKAPVEDTVLAPGDSTRIDIFFDTQRYGGYVTKKPYVMTNAGEEPVFLTFHSHVLSVADSTLPIILTPNRLDVSQFTEMPRRKATFTIHNTSAKDYTLTVIDCPADYFAVKLPPVVKAGETAEGSVEVLENRVGEEFERSLTFAISDEAGTRYTLPVKRMVRVKKGAVGS
ncbi:MAG TPA: DUF1573 domain-containing protein [candidate division Zixibacteria bacterium]|nr:DUF1573 domain-containing protein [candidate division Zixibacteria bacterium]